MVYSEFREQIYLAFLAGPELEEEAEIRETGRNRLNPNCSGPITEEVMVWLPGLVAAEDVSIGESFIFLCNLAIFSISGLSGKNPSC